MVSDWEITPLVKEMMQPLPHPDGIGEISQGKGPDSPSHLFRAGQLHVYVDQWEYLGAPPHILKMVTGYRIPFKQKPPLHTPNFQHQTNVSPEMSKIIKKLVLEGVLEEARVTPSFISTIFLRPKSDGTSRPIFNLKRLNNFVHAGKFRLVNVQRVPDFIQENDWMAKIDLRQAYFHLPVAQAHRRFLRLIYANKLWQITCLPFGLSSAPKAFACLTNWIAQCLRNRGVRILVYLDDFFLVNQDAATLQKHIVVTISLLRSLGWEINTEKSVLTPRKALEFLGLIWDPWQNLKYLPDRLTTKIESLSANLLAKKKTTLLDLQKIIGMMNFACFVVKRGRLHYRALQALSNKMLACPRIKTLPLPAQVILELIWWQRNCRTHSQLHIPAPRHYLTTDASDLGWGAILDNQKLQGCWTHSQQRLHCNQKEMLAILNVLNLRGKSLASKGLLIQSDNSSVIAYLRNEGGTKSVALTNLTKKVYQILDLYNIRISVYHIPGSYNCYADRLSRRQITPEWHLLPPLTQIVFKKMGHANSRPLRVTRRTRSADILHTRQDRQTSDLLRCSGYGMEFSPGMAVSTPASHSQSPSSSEQSNRVLFDNCASLGGRLLEARLEKSCSGRSVHDQESVTSPDRYNNGAPSTESVGDEPRDMEMWGWSKQLTGWTKDQKDLLSASWRRSTLKTYKPAWARWLSWARAQKISINNPTASDLARFLADLHQKDGFSLSTIRVHKSVVVTFSNPDNQEKLNSHTLVRHVLKAIALAKQRPQKPPIWDTSIMEQFLNTKDANTSSLYEASKCTAAILLLCSGRRVHDLTLLKISPQHYITEEDGIIFKPAFGSKTDSSTQQQSSWKLISNKDNVRLCPVHWVKHLIHLSQEKRGVANSDSLFIALTGRPRPASRTIIAGWVKKLLQEAGIKATAGSFRSAVASKNWVENFPLDDILVRGNWKSANTFKKFYRKDITNSMINSNTVSKLFVPTDD
ncbi:uncharacterized protein LOC123722583 [Papilio machaon]|uniref:uncharacterized protein LOC123722583 n=1 Tax=Papilio machaon TaxID=76193 RepID=UPI001E66495D|nr:uncharacterized protein LOC123722583 [Papilio machaon]